MRRTEPGLSTFGTDGSSGTDPSPSNRTQRHLRLAADCVAHRIGENGAERRCRQHQRGRGTLFNHEAQEHARERADAKRRDRLGDTSNRSTRASMMFGQRPKAPGTCGHIASRTISHGWEIRRTSGRKLVGTARFELATPRPPVWCASQAALRPDRPIVPRGKDSRTDGDQIELARALPARRRPPPRSLALLDPPSSGRPA
jgi:hypothetical protein